MLQKLSHNGFHYKSICSVQAKGDKLWENPLWSSVKLPRKVNIILSLVLLILRFAQFANLDLYIVVYSNYLIFELCFKDYPYITQGGGHSGPITMIPSVPIKVRSDD